ASGDGQRVNVMHKLIATPISNGTFNFEIQNNTLTVSNIRARLGGGDCRATYSLQGLLERGDFDFHGQIDNLNVSPQLGEVLNEQGRKFFADFLPTGLVSVQFHVGEKANQPFRSVRANVHDLAVTYVKFPYQLEHFVGNFSFINNRCELDVQSLMGAEILTLKGYVQNPGPSAVMDIQFECPGSLPIDDKLFRAIKAYPNIHKQVLALKPRGQFSVAGRFQKTDPQLPVNLNYTIALDQCQVRHDSFDYPFKNVSGKVVVEGQQVGFQDILGENLSSKVSCNGNWDPQDGLKLRFWCQNVSLDEQLRIAVPELVKRVWSEIRPAGKIPLVRVDLAHPRNAANPQVDLQIDSRSDQQSDESSLSIKPVSFPYEIGNIEALITFENNKIKIADLHGAHGRTWVTCRGTGEYSSTSWTLQLADLLTGAIPVNQDFLSALPVGLQCPLENLNFQGSFNLSGSMTLSGGQVTPNDLANEPETAGDIAKVAFVAPAEGSQNATSISWDFRLDVDRGEMNVGLDVSELHGQMRLVGAYDGTRAYSEGEIALESMTVLNTQVTNVKGPIWIDQDHVGVGFFATPLGSKPNPLSLSGDVLGGQIEFDGHTWYEGRQKFYLQTTVSNVSLRAAATNFSPTLESIDGRSQLALRLSGDSSATDSLQGEGLIKMYNARIYELPVLLAALKQLRNFNEDKSAFDSGHIDFGVKGKVISISRMELNGEPISLIGNGQIDLDQNVDLNFYSIAGRNRFEIPLISDLYKASSQQIMWINVGGTLKAPRTSQEILPGVNEGLKELFNPRSLSNQD
ncbi:MAG: AsmA-like C-terminal domain-containing protein, partial [Pirellulaceae bacterium]